MDMIKMMARYGVVDSYVNNAVRTEAPITPEVMARMETCARLVHAQMGLITELGEFVDKLKREVFYNAPSDKVNDAEELGDFFWYLAIIMHAKGIDPIACMFANIEKLKKRFPKAFTEHDAVNRDLDGERAVLEEHLSTCAQHEPTAEGIRIKRRSLEQGQLTPAELEAAYEESSKRDDAQQEFLRRAAMRSTGDAPDHPEKEEN